MSEMARACKFCGTPLGDERRVCPVCGMRSTMGFQDHIPVPGRALPPREALPPDPAAGMALLLAGAALLAGSFLPWVANSVGEKLSGAGFVGAGISTAVIGSVLAALGAWGAKVSTSRILFAAGTVLALTAAALVGLYLGGTKAYLGGQASRALWLDRHELVSLEGGIFVAAAGAVLGTCAAVFGLVRAWRRRPSGSV